jgi:hypothetical protein
MVVLNNKVFFLGLFLFCLLFVNYFFMNGVTSSSLEVQNYIQKYSFSNGLRLPKKYNSISETDKTFFMSNVVAIPSLDTISLLTDEINQSLPFRNSKVHRAKYIKKGSEDIWMGSFAVELPLAILTFLTKVQNTLNVHGTIGEIGVHGGLFFIGLAHLALEGEKYWACDVFGNQALNLDGSGFGNEGYFLSKTQAYGIFQEDLTVVSGSSLNLNEDFLKESSLDKFRLISVDGGHTRQTVFNDLTLAAINLAEGGIIILNDVNNHDWPGVIDGLITWLSIYPEKFGVFFSGHNKVFISQKKYHFTYYDSIQKHEFWKKFVVDNPSSNDNIHKSPESGKNHFSYGGLQFLDLAYKFPNGNDLKKQYLKEHDVELFQ